MRLTFHPAGEVMTTEPVPPQESGTPEPFMFVFSTGAKWSSEMTREELLQVIEWQQHWINFGKRELDKAYKTLAEIVG